MWLLEYIIPVFLGALFLGSLYTYVKLFIIRKKWEKQGVQYMGTSLFRNIFSTFKKRSILYDTLDMYQILKDKKLLYMGYAEGLTPGLFVQDVEMIKHIVIKNFDHFTDRIALDWAHDPHLGRTLIFLKGNQWKQVRSALSPAFTTGKIKRLFKLFQATGEKLVKYI